MQRIVELHWPSFLAGAAAGIVALLFVVGMGRGLVW